MEGEGTRGFQGDDLNEKLGYSEGILEETGVSRGGDFGDCGYLDLHVEGKVRSGIF